MTGAPDDPDGDHPEDTPSSAERADGGNVGFTDLTPAVERVAGPDTESERANDAESTVSGVEPARDVGDEAIADDDEPTDGGAPPGAEAEAADDADGPLADDDMAFTEPDAGSKTGSDAGSDASGAVQASAAVDHWPTLKPAVVRAEHGAVESTDGGGVARQPGAGEQAFPTSPEDPEGPEDDPLLGGGTAPDDEELPLADHIEEMVFRAAIIVGVAGAVSVLLFPFGDTLINIIWNHVIPGATAAGDQGIRPHLYAPLDLLITQFKVASLAGVIVALPVLVYETYAFMRPGLYPNERRYYLAAIPTSLVLAVVGVLFAFFIVLPASFGYLIGYSNYVANSALALTSTFSMVLVVMGYLALVFQLPLFMMLAVMMKLTTRQWIEDRRLLFWGAFAGLSFMFASIDVSGVTPIIVAITMIVLFEGTLLLLRWTGR